MTSVASRCFVLLDKEPTILEMKNKYIEKDIDIYIDTFSVFSHTESILAWAHRFAIF